MANANVLNITAADFDKEVLNSPVPVLVDFWAPWCGPCKMMGPILDEIAAEKGDQVKICKLNVDPEPEQQLASTFNVAGIPAFLYFKAGRKVDRVDGRVPKSTLVNKLDALI